MVSTLLHFNRLFHLLFTYVFVCLFVFPSFKSLSTVAILVLRLRDKKLDHDIGLENLCPSFVIRDIGWLDRPLDCVCPLVTGVIYSLYVSVTNFSLCYTYFSLSLPLLRTLTTASSQCCYFIIGLFVLLLLLLLLLVLLLFLYLNYFLQ